MARIVGIFNASHTPFCFAPPERWDEMRAARDLRADVPLDDLAENRRKAARLDDALATLRQKIAEARPDVVVTFASDQLESFDFNNLPAFAIYLGEEFEGRSSTVNASPPQPGAEVPKRRLRGHPELGTGILTGPVAPSISTTTANPPASWWNGRSS